MATLKMYRNHLRNITRTPEITRFDFEVLILILVKIT